MDLNEKLKRLRQTVDEGKVKLHEEAERKRQILRAEKARDWNRILEKEPEAAAFVTEVAKEFGKPERVLIVNETEVLLDSRKYDPLYDSNKRRR